MEGKRKIMKYDYLIVGAGLFGAIFAYEAKKAGKDRKSTRLNSSHIH